MKELLVVLGAQVILILSILAMKLHLWRTDVLNGAYIDSESAPRNSAGDIRLGFFGWMKSLRADRKSVSETPFETPLIKSLQDGGGLARPR
jgi:hypothetical protein